MKKDFLTEMSELNKPIIATPDELDKDFIELMKRLQKYSEDTKEDRRKFERLRLRKVRYC
jgi:hypothetical protein